ncbi:MAG: glutamine-hydrolyzing GMP synthase, partial [Nitrospinae bacterium]|nr:glutamine-hydrolyzing GMP synthase [Nitrospinota bacterium]
MTAEDLHKQKILVLDYGSQYTQNIARKVRECKVYCEIHPCTVDIDQIIKYHPKGIILSGGPASVHEPGAPLCPPGLFDLRIPILGICYGMQLIAHQLGGAVDPSPHREYGRAQLMIREYSRLFQNVKNNSAVWMSHGDRINKVPAGFKATAFTENSPIAAIEDPLAKIYAIQFHPEVAHTAEGKLILQNFLYDICGCGQFWEGGWFADYAIGDIRDRLGEEGRAICALSGGVDSSVVAVLMQ